MAIVPINKNKTNEPMEEDEFVLCCSECEGDQFEIIVDAPEDGWTQILALRCLACGAEQNSNYH